MTKEDECEEKYPMLVGNQYGAKWLKCVWGDSRIQFETRYAPSGKAKCKFCKKIIAKGSLKLMKLTPNPWDAEGGFNNLELNYHPDHFFQQMLKARKKTKVPISITDFIGFKKLKRKDQNIVKRLLKKFLIKRKIKVKSKTMKKKTKKSKK